MFLCPQDRTELVRREARKSVYWSCPECGGRTATTAALRRTAPREVVDRLWEAARRAAEGDRRCPACELPMKAVALPLDGAALDLDICTRCYFVWFDASQFEALPPPRPSSGREAEKLPLEARLALAKMEVEQLDTRPDFTLPPSEPPPEGWKAVPAIFGLPVKQESNPLVELPLATWLLAGLTAVLGGLALLNIDAVAADFGLIPAELWRYGGLTLLTSFLLHGSLPQLAGNLYFLLTFGTDVEDYLGSGRFLLLLLIASLAGSFLHVSVHPGSATPLIGASSAISGIVTCYGLQFPRARIGFLLRLPRLFFLRWVNLRAWVYVLVWIALQAMGALRPAEGLTQVSLWAHLGGAATGFLFWFLWPGNGARAEAPPSEPQS
ncbi:MAG TPA: rhomboid family intramembrane serine protease [Terriglobia bacterium]|nr:rhomboid family intramembrane serine protease [Terriglobia bacterium]